MNGTIHDFCVWKKLEYTGKSGNCSNRRKLPCLAVVSFGGIEKQHGGYQQQVNSPNGGSSHRTPIGAGTRTECDVSTLRLSFTTAAAPIYTAACAFLKGCCMGWSRHSIKKVGKGISVCSSHAHDKPAANKHHQVGSNETKFVFAYSHIVYGF